MGNNNTKKDENLCECGKRSEYMISVATIYYLSEDDLPSLTLYSKYNGWNWSKWFIKAYPCHDCSCKIREELGKTNIGYSVSQI